MLSIAGNRSDDDFKRYLNLPVIAMLTAAVVLFALDKFAWSENPSSAIKAPLLVKLSTTPLLFFPSPIAAVLRFRNSDKSIPEIGLELNVAFVLEGGVQRSGDHVRVNAQLIDVKTDRHLWAETFDRTLSTTNLFAILK